MIVESRRDTKEGNKYLVEMINKLAYPKVSVVICTYNRVYWLQKCLDSIMKLDYPNYEVVVVYIDTNDGTKELLEKYSINSVRQERLSGLSAAWNMGAEESNGDIIAFIDDDEVVRNDWLLKLTGAYDDPNICGVGGPVYKLGLNEFQFEKTKANKFGKTRNISCNAEVPRNEFLILQGGNMSFRKEVFKKLGGFDPCFTFFNGDMDLCVRAIQQGYNLKHEPNAIVWHANVGGGPHQDEIYSSSKSRTYFSIKNFGRWDNILQLLFYDTAFLIANLGYYFISYLLRRISLKKLLGVYREMIKGRFDGYREGFRSQREEKIP
jgi:GT2 family glycosyltransferase